MIERERERERERAAREREREPLEREGAGRERGPLERARARERRHSREKECRARACEREPHARERYREPLERASERSQSPRPRPAGRPPSTVISAGLTGILLPTTSPSFHHLLERTDVAVMLDIGHRGDLRHLPDSADNEYRPPHRRARRQRQRRPHPSQPTPPPPARLFPLLPLSILSRATQLICFFRSNTPLRRFVG